MSFDGFAAVEDDSTLESVTPDDHYGGDSDHGDGGHSDGDDVDGGHGDGDDGEPKFASPFWIFPLCSFAHLKIMQYRQNINI